MKRALLLFTTLFVVLIAFAGNPFDSDTTFLWMVKAKPMAIDKSQSQMGSLSVLKGEERLFCFYYVDEANEKLPKGIYLTGNPNRISRYVLKLYVENVDPD